MSGVMTYLIGVFWTGMVAVMFAAAPDLLRSPIWVPIVVITCVLGGFSDALSNTINELERNRKR